MEKSIEAEKVMQYDKLFHKMAHRFLQKSYGFDKGRTSHDDLYQVLRLKFVELLRKGEINESYIAIGNEYKLITAMREYIQKNTPITIPRDYDLRVPDFYKVEEADSPIECHGIAQIPFYDWVERLPANEKKVANAIIEGKTPIEMVQSGIVTNFPKLRRTKSAIAKKYLEWAA